MKIIIVSINGIGIAGGVERVCFYLNEILSKEYTVKILTGKHLPFGKLNTIIQPTLISVRLLFMKNKIVISNSWQSFLYPVDFSIHHGTTFGYMSKVPELKKLSSVIIGCMEKISCRTAKNIVVVSKNAANELIKYYKADIKKLIIFNNFVNEKYFYPDEISANNDIKILFSGRLEEGKGLGVLKLLSNYLENIEGYNLTIACNDSRNTKLFQNNRKTKVIIGLQIEQMCSFYNNGDILFFPSKYEGFSMATLEALSCGLPVIGTEYAIPEELRHNDFVKVFDFAKLDLEELLKQAKGLICKFSVKKKEIHEKIKQDFGYAQYEKRLLSIIKKYTNQGDSLYAE
jgi:glycosyltransferase involved in cell wall biosynthesis